MSNATKRTVVDPAAAAQKFKDDLAAMAVGHKGVGAPIGQRQLDKHFGVATYKFNRWSAELGEQQTLEHALEPTFWAAQAEKIMGHDKSKPRGRGDIIEVRKADTGLYAELLVTEIGTGFVKTVLIRSAEAPAVEVPDAAALTTKWNPSAKLHDVVRKADGQVMRAGFQTKQAAVAWIAEHVAVMAQPASGGEPAA